LGNTHDKQVVPLLTGLLRDAKIEASVRKQAVRGLAQTLEGAREVLKAAKAGELPEDLKFVATGELNGARWPEIKKEAAEVLPAPQGQNAQALPPVFELLKTPGTVANGEKVFFRETSACATCHRVKGTGGEIGPNLSEIGSKLGKDALYEAVLDPSAGVLMGYETYSVETKSGDELYGLLVSETADELAIKDLKGLVTRVKKSDVTKREKMPGSIMPTGLQATMTTQELVDLIEFLSSLKKQ
jgi:putative heme-binding domain-containing protein